MAAISGRFFIGAGQSAAPELIATEQAQPGGTEVATIPVTQLPVPAPRAVGTELLVHGAISLASIGAVATLAATSAPTLTVVIASVGAAIYSGIAAARYAMSRRPDAGVLAAMASETAALARAREALVGELAAIRQERASLRTEREAVDAQVREAAERLFATDPQAAEGAQATLQAEREKAASDRVDPHLDLILITPASTPEVVIDELLGYVERQEALSFASLRLLLQKMPRGAHSYSYAGDFHRRFAERIGTDRTCHRDHALVSDALAKTKKTDDLSALKTVRVHVREVVTSSAQIGVTTNPRGEVERLLLSQVEALLESNPSAQRSEA